MKWLEMLLRHRVKTSVMLLTLAAVAWFIYDHHEELSREAIIQFGRQLPAVWLVALFLVLPLMGFPVSIFLFVVGIRFGFVGGMAVSAVATFFHNYVAFRLTHGLFRNRLRAYLERVGYGIPPIDMHHRFRFTLLFAAIHGPPYVAKIYLLALTDVPFRFYFWVGSVVYIIFAAIPVGAGSAVAHLDATWIYIIITLFAIVPLVGFWLRRRFGGEKSEPAPVTRGSPESLPE